MEQARCVFVIHLLQNGIRKLDSIDSPTALRGCFGGSVVEVFVPRLQKSVVNLIELVVEDLLGKFVAVGGPRWWSTSKAQL